MKNEVVILSFVVATVVMLNFSLILVIESSKPEPISQKILRAVTGNNQLEIFSVQSFGEKEVSKKTDSRRTSSKKVSTTSVITSDILTPQAEKTLSWKEEIELTVDEGVKPIDYAFFDYNNDGTLDLIRKELDGKYYAYLNKGTNEERIYKEGTFIEEKQIKSLNINFIKSQEVSTTSARGTQSINWIPLSYPRFDVYIEESYYNNYTSYLENYLSNLNDRFVVLEEQTGWSSEKFYGMKTTLNITPSSNCWNGTASETKANLGLYFNITNATQCRQPYYVDGTPYLGNPGELGDDWVFMTGGLHELLHTMNPSLNSIKPSPIRYRVWLTEGFSEYYQFNILSNYNGNGNNDINQETTDYYMYHGNFSGYPWQDYISNDYKDYTNKPIQESGGYDLTAWMFSMMRDNKSLNWQKFYSILENNLETLNGSMRINGTPVNSKTYIDTYIIDVFGKASGKNFNQTQAIWRYDGPFGPGWGVRNWTNLDWYADLSPKINSSKISANPGDLLQLGVNVSNNGNVSLINVPVNIYVYNCLVVANKMVNVSSNNYTIVNTNYTAPYRGMINFIVRVDEENIKIEKNESNNQDTITVNVGCYTYFDKTLWKYVNTCSNSMAYKCYDS